MGGEIVGLTADTQANANGAKRAWGIDFPLLADPSCQLVALMNGKGWITSAIERNDTVTDLDFKAFTQRFLKMGFGVGMLQPGVVGLRGPVDDVAPPPANTDTGTAGATVAIAAAAAAAAAADEDASDGAGWASITCDPEILVTWGSVPSAANVNGATNRLKPKNAVAVVKASLAGDFSLARPAVVQGESSRSKMDNPSLPLLYMLLMAHGNFVGPRAFVQNPDGNALVGATARFILHERDAIPTVLVWAGGRGLPTFEPAAFAMLVASPHTDVRARECVHQHARVPTLTLTPPMPMPTPSRACPWANTPLAHPPPTIRHRRLRAADQFGDAEARGRHRRGRVRALEGPQHDRRRHRALCRVVLAAPGALARRPHGLDTPTQTVMGRGGVRCAKAGRRSRGNIGHV